LLEIGFEADHTALLLSLSFTSLLFPLYFTPCLFPPLYFLDLPSHQASRDAAKKAKEAAKKNLKKFKKTISASITSLNYFVPAGSAPSASVIEGVLTDLDNLVAGLQPEQVKDVAGEVEKAGSDATKVKAVLADWAKKVEGKEFKQFV
jgi:hypothetical protein